MLSDSGLAYTERNHSMDMVVKDYYDHTTPEGKRFSDRMNEAGINRSWGGEILSYMYPGGPTHTVLGFFVSNEHRSIMLYPSAQYAGVGAAFGGEDGYLTVGFY